MNTSRGCTVRFAALASTLFAGAGEIPGHTVLHHFGSIASDGANPQRALTIHQGTVYGFTSVGGAYTYGTIFRLDPNGSNYTVLRSMSWTDGANPITSPLIVDDTLFGSAYDGGVGSSGGGLFKIRTNGSGFSAVYKFSLSSGRYPIANILCDGARLYTMPGLGGSGDEGTIFCIGTNGAGATVLRHFLGGATNGANPRWCGMTLSDGLLYGVTSQGGAAGSGVVFRVSTNGAGFTVLYTFAGGVTNGAKPQGSPLLAGDTLYGVTQYGGSQNKGVVYKVKTDGTGFAVLHHFAGGAGDGRGPLDGLALAGDRLYGTTEYGSAADRGVVYSLRTDGSGFVVLHEFAGGPDDGQRPFGAPVVFVSDLYGTTFEGGAHGKGVLYRLPIVTAPGLSAFGPDGRLTWANDPGVPAYRVEWTSMLGPTSVWKRDWWDLRYVAPTGSQSVVAVPMNYRVIADATAYDQTLLDGPWMAIMPDPAENAYLLFDGAGEVDDSGVFNAGQPPGWYGVWPDGTFHLVLSFTNDPPFVMVGEIRSASDIAVQKPFPIERLLRVTDPAAGQGSWSGTLNQTNPVTATRTVTFDVTAAGVVTNVAGLAGPVSGRLFALSSSGGVASAFLRTAEGDPFSELRLSGLLSNQVFSGALSLAEGDAGGTFQLQR